MNIQSFSNKMFSNPRWPLYFFIMITVMSQFFTAGMNIINSLLWWKRIDLDLILIGCIDSFVVTTLIAPPVIYLMKRYFNLEEINLKLQKEFTERTLAENALRTSEEKLNSIVSTSQEWIWSKDLTGVYTFSNPAVRDILGHSPDDILGRAAANSLVHKEDLLLAKELLSRSIALRTGWSNIVTRWMHKDGTYRYLESSAVPMLDQSGSLYGFQGTDRDITVRKQSEDDVRKSEERYRTIFESTATANILMAQDLTILMANDDFAGLSGYSKQELEGKIKLTAFADGHDLTRVMSYDKMRRLDPGSALSSNEFRFTSRSGEVREVFVSVAVIPKTNESVVSLVDLTERRHLETQLIQSQKMESVGRLAGGVAHDFNNMLSVIIGNTEIAMLTVDPASPLRRTLQDIMSAGLRSADLTRQLLAFARKQTASPRVLNLSDTVTGMLKMLQRLIGENIHLIWMPGQNLWKVKIDPSQVDQILVNLTVNARDAIGQKGKITIETSNASCDEGYRNGFADFTAGDYVELSIRDDGCGMEKHTLANIFEPFYTTGKNGQGTGLGLATVYGIVKQNGGFIDVRSEPGQGSIFRIYLPRYTDTSSEATDDESDTPIPGGTETVLIVEDEETVLKLGRAMLETLGYNVLEAKSADQALKLAGEYAGKIDLLLTDVIMPDMNGKELAERILAVKPGLKCLYTSGYTADVIAHQGILDKRVQFISKPFSLKDLAAKIREAVGE
ncbi:MAG: PAS domain-containing sensor histidine kinase [Deltaproteobacteria bacterium]|nr:PAS domain-containing sensor histidine kinase [Deltaproteobacteria bacterium]